MLQAARDWHAQNPAVELKFKPLGFAARTFVIAGLDSALIRRVGASPKTRELLRAMDAATGNNGTVAMADACIEMVFGLRHALTVRPEDLPRKLDPHTNRGDHGACPACGKLLDATTNMYGSATPSAGDFTICAYCTEILRFDEQLHVRLTTLEDREHLPPEAIEMIEAMARMPRPEGAKPKDKSDE